MSSNKLILSVENLTIGYDKALVEGINLEVNVGDVITITPGVKHSFSTKNGSVVEEISSTHYVDDSFYTDESISLNKDRKSFISI